MLKLKPVLSVKAKQFLEGHELLLASVAMCEEQNSCCVWSKPEKQNPGCGRFTWWKSGLGWVLDQHKPP